MSSIFGLVHLDESPIDIASAKLSSLTLQHRGAPVFEQCTWQNVFLSARRHAGEAGSAGAFQSPGKSGVFEGLAFFPEPVTAFGNRSSEEVMSLPGELAAASITNNGKKVSLFRDPVGLRTL